MLFRGKIEPPRIKKSHKDLCACGNKEVLCSKNVKVEIYRIQKKGREGVSLLRIVLSFAWKQYFGAAKKETRSYRFSSKHDFRAIVPIAKCDPGKK